MVDWRLAERVAAAVSARTGPAAGDSSAVADEVPDFAVRSAELVSEYTGLASPERAAAGGDGGPRRVGGDQPRLHEDGARPRDRQAGGGPRRPGRPHARRHRDAARRGGRRAERVPRRAGARPVRVPRSPIRTRRRGCSSSAPTSPRRRSRCSPTTRRLVRWVALHETTHALQFAGVPWLRAHMATGSRSSWGPWTCPSTCARWRSSPSSTTSARSWTRSARRGSSRSWPGPERRALLDELQATMALIEGYAEHVMDATGEALLPDLPRLRKSLEKRRKERSGMLRDLRAPDRARAQAAPVRAGQGLLRRGRRGGRHRGLNRAWDSPPSLPTLADLDDPSGWLRRVSVAA